MHSCCPYLSTGGIINKKILVLLLIWDWKEVLASMQSSHRCLEWLPKIYELSRVTIHIYLFIVNHGLYASFFLLYMRDSSHSLSCMICRLPKEIIVVVNPFRCYWEPLNFLIPLVVITWLGLETFSSLVCLLHTRLGTCFNACLILQQLVTLANQSC